MRVLLLLCSLLLTVALPAAAKAPHVRDGDLLFVTAARTGLSGAIDDATGKQGQASYDHVALVAHDAQGKIVLHADEEGSRQQTLAAFLAEAKAKQRQVVVYRLKPDTRKAIPAAIATARTLLGKPYNFTYVQAEDSYYCSDFIERAFRADHVFALQPMNFRNPQTGQISQYWIDFYRGKGMDVPQDKPGTNPNDMAASPALERLGALD
ncbi:Permuted papain-like amidase enzyme, YaeF/YiiX, C92 family [Pseudoxanthomonas sp. GM95]|uniref:YiiX/YebB-like N1pC/P60 family cysteine hydrolase n=1 Tax=Pseudoxanthomonas sp. GM95 TaxID=1881043 RepID=UPI0008B2C651|nr:YiiX/YebB-like N1pC/P60 family cysteine hydrolase [Pseudoxanthomonas sp. GM95]SEM11166.1 Permuted papain-like amidase enzyme, YaeF/YiiX, C92 family [Pseudoxanthomonas sp. GM95]